MCRPSPRCLAVHVLGTVNASELLICMQATCKPTFHDSCLFHFLNAWTYFNETSNSQLVLGGTTVLPWNRGTFFTVLVPSRSRYYRSTAIPLYRGTTVRYLPTNSHFSQDFSCNKNQVNKLEVFKLHVDDIWCNWWQSDGATAQLKRDWCSCAAALCWVIM